MLGLNTKVRGGTEGRDCPSGRQAVEGKEEI